MEPSATNRQISVVGQKRQVPTQSTLVHSRWTRGTSASPRRKTWRLVSTWTPSFNRWFSNKQLRALWTWYHILFVVVLQVQKKWSGGSLKSPDRDLELDQLYKVWLKLFEWSCFVWLYLFFDWLPSKLKKHIHQATAQLGSSSVRSLTSRCLIFSWWEMFCKAFFLSNNV